MSNDVYAALALLADIDSSNYQHPYHDKTHPQHRAALQAYQELTEYCFNALNRSGSRDYPTNVPPPPLKETRKGFFMRPP